MTRPKGNSEALVERRLRALALLDSGYTLNEVARNLRCSPSSVMRWRNARRNGGARGLQVRRSPGRPLKLSSEQRSRLAELLLKGPRAFGFENRYWTSAQIIALICENFGVQYHPSHMRRLLQSLPLRLTMPDDGAVQALLEKRLP